MVVARSTMPPVRLQVGALGTTCRPVVTYTLAIYAAMAVAAGAATSAMGSIGEDVDADVGPWRRRVDTHSHAIGTVYFTA